MIQQETLPLTTNISPEKAEKLDKNERDTIVACGLDPALVGERIGRGWNSKVYRYYLPDDSHEWVVKVPSRLPFSIRETVKEEERNIGLVKKYFEGFTPESILKRDESGENFC